MAWPQRRESRIGRPNAPVAQGTEQRTSNPPVAGSNPAGRAPNLRANAEKLREARSSIPSLVVALAPRPFSLRLVAAFGPSRCGNSSHRFARSSALSSEAAEATDLARSIQADRASCIAYASRIHEPLRGLGLRLASRACSTDPFARSHSRVDVWRWPRGAARDRGYPAKSVCAQVTRRAVSGGNSGGRLSAKAASPIP